MKTRSKSDNECPLIIDMCQSSNLLEHSEHESSVNNGFINNSIKSSNHSAKCDLKSNFAQLLQADENDIVREQIDRHASDSEIISMEDVRRKSLFERICRPMGPGSIRGSSLTLISGCAGVGMLGLPKVMSYFGLMTGTL